MKFFLFNKKKKKIWEKYYDKGKVNVEVPSVSIYEYLYNRNIDRLNNIAIDYYGNKITYQELFHKIDLCAKAMRSQGIRKGDVVSICLPNVVEAVIIFYAVSKIGGIANMIHPLSAEEEIKKSIIDTKSVMLFTINFNYQKILNVIEETSLYKTIIVSPRDSMPKGFRIGYFLLEDRKIKNPKSNEIFMYWKSFLEKGKDYKREVLNPSKWNEAAVILHSGGTSGSPKSIVLSNGNINVIIEQAVVTILDNNERDSMLGVLPMFHCFGLVEGIHYPLSLGARVIMIPKFDASRFDKLLKKYRPTIIPGVPTLFEGMMNNKHMDKVDLSNVKYVICGGDALNRERNLALNNFLKSHNCVHGVVQGYGMTETTGACVFSNFNSYTLGSVGIPLPGNDLKIVNPDTKEEVDIGEVGEILISGPSVMMGYLNDELETNKVLEKDNKGNIWVHSGDLGYIDKNGCLFFVQRLKRIIISSGYNIYPSHIEEVLNKHPYIINSCVIGVPHPYKVQVPKAYIVLDYNINDSFKVRNEIKEYCEKNLAKYMIPKEFVYRKSLPKTNIGKVDYKKLEQEKDD